jgi:K+-sensing histidine kinase KdpD
MRKRRSIIIFFLENIFYYTVIVFLFKNLIGQGEEFLHLNLHPLFILTGIMAYRYGVNLGVISATMATFMYMYSYIEAGHDIVVFFYDFKYYKFILMFYIISFILGRIRDNKEERSNEFAEEISIIRKNYKSLYEKNNKLTYINNRMKSQIIKSEESIISLYNISNTLDILSSEEVITNLIGVFKTYINAEAISLYTVDSSKKYMRLKVAVGENRKLSGSLKLDEYPEFLKVINDKKYGKRDGTNLKIPVFYAPILNNGEVIALLNIERLSYETYTDYTEKMFEILASWTNKAISNAISYAEKIKDEVYYE